MIATITADVIAIVALLARLKNAIATDGLWTRLLVQNRVHEERDVAQTRAIAIEVDARAIDLRIRIRDAKQAIHKRLNVPAVQYAIRKDIAGAVTNRFADAAEINRSV